MEVENGISNFQMLTHSKNITLQNKLPDCYIRLVSSGSFKLVRIPQWTVGLTQRDRKFPISELPQSIAESVVSVISIAKLRQSCHTNILNNFNLKLFSSNF